MKIVRYQDASGSIHFGNRHADGHTTRIDGDILGVYADTGTSVTPHTLLRQSSHATLFVLVSTTENMPPRGINRSPNTRLFS